jgi:hypothetical protein
MAELTKGFLEAAAHVVTDHNLAAYTVAALLAVVLFGLKMLGGSRRGLQGWTLILALVLVSLVGTSPLLASTYLNYFSLTATVRVTVIGPNGTIVDDADVTSNIGGEVKRVSGGWEIAVPADSLPTSGEITIRAEQKSTFSHGQTTVSSAGRRKLVPATVTLKHDTSARVRGIVVDARGNAVKGARVQVVGYDSEGTVTSDGGGFDLPAQAAAGERVPLHAEKQGYKAVNENYPAGDVSARLVLRR